MCKASSQPVRTFWGRGGGRVRASVRTRTQGVARHARISRRPHASASRARQWGTRMQTGPNTTQRAGYLTGIISSTLKFGTCDVTMKHAIPTRTIPALRDPQQKLSNAAPSRWQCSRHSQGAPEASDWSRNRHQALWQAVNFAAAARPPPAPHLAHTARMGLASSAHEPIR